MSKNIVMVTVANHCFHPPIFFHLVHLGVESAGAFLHGHPQEFVIFNPKYIRLGNQSQG